jgi:ribosomal protein S6--L-glutamate ligase
MKIGILSRNRHLHSIQRLLKEAKSLRVQCEVYDPLDCQVVVSKDNHHVLYHDKPITDLDAVIPRIGTSITDYGLAVVKQFENLGVKVVNSSLGIAQSRDKFRCLQVLSANKIDVPATVLMKGSRGLKVALRYVHGTPAVVKMIQGTQGVGVMIVESRSSAESVLDTLKDLGHDVLLQQFIIESRGTDLRLFVIGDHVVAAMKRVASPGEFRSNIHRGGEGQYIEVNDVYKKIAVQSVKALGLGIAGVDIIESITGPKVLEVNSTPGFEGIEKATGINIARMMIEYTVNCVKNKKSKLKIRKL